MQLKIFDIVNKRLKNESHDLLARKTGRDTFKKVSTRLGDIEKGEVVELDFADIRVMDPSFIDEFLINLIEESLPEKNDYYIKLLNLLKISEINISNVFKSYYNHTGKKIAVALDSISFENKYYIGPLTEIENEIVNYMRINRSVKIEQIAENISQNTGTVEKLLENLFICRLIRKIDKSSGIYYLV